MIGLMSEREQLHKILPSFPASSPKKSPKGPKTALGSAKRKKSDGKNTGSVGGSKRNTRVATIMTSSRKVKATVAVKKAKNSKNKSSSVAQKQAKSRKGKNASAVSKAKAVTKKTSTAKARVSKNKAQNNKRGGTQDGRNKTAKRESRATRSNRSE